jgi:hypothetical protein
VPARSPQCRARNSELRVGPVGAVFLISGSYRDDSIGLARGDADGIDPGLDIDA